MKHITVESLINPFAAIDYELRLYVKLSELIIRNVRTEKLLIIKNVRTDIIF
jgi:hypothetical protein